MYTFAAAEEAAAAAGAGINSVPFFVQGSSALKKNARRDNSLISVSTVKGVP
jgi:predicted DsbA family dithiol-disulfide isomerase